MQHGKDRAALARTERPRRRPPRGGSPRGLAPAIVARARQAERRDHFRTPAEARRKLFDYVEGWYNPRRRHSALGYESPLSYERRYAAAAHRAAAPAKARAVEPPGATLTERRG
jgi:putative transposase